MEAYKATNFKVLTKPPFILNIGKRSKEVLEVFEHTSSNCAGYLTAWNPYSQSMSGEENEQAHHRLLAQLDLDNYQVWMAIGEDPSGEWGGETSAFVLGMPRSDAAAYGKQFEQNAIVWVGNTGVPELVRLR
jgi:hypothetical protein